MRIDSVKVVPTRRMAIMVVVLTVTVAVLAGVIFVQTKRVSTLEQRLVATMFDRDEAIDRATFDRNRSLAMVESERDRQLASMESQWEEQVATAEDQFEAAMAVIRMRSGAGSDPQLSAEQIAIRDNLLASIERFDHNREVARLTRDARRLAARSVETSQIEAIVRSVMHWANHYYEDRARYRIPLILAMVGVESHFRMDAVSSMDARCAMQVLPVHVDEIDFLTHVSDLSDIDKCVRAGIHILHRYETQSKGNLVTALLRYGGVSQDNRSAHHFYIQRVRDTQARLSMNWHIPEDELLGPVQQELSELNDELERLRATHQREVAALTSEVTALRARRADLEQTVSSAMQMCMADYQASN